MSSGCAIDKALGFYTEYLQMYPHTKQWVWNPEEENRDASEDFIGKASYKKFSQ